MDGSPTHHLRNFIFSKFGILTLAAIVFLLVLEWAKNRDPYRRVEFSLTTSMGGSVRGMVVLPKPVVRHPVVIYIHGSGENLTSCGSVLRQFAELGLAAVGVEYDQTNRSIFDQQFLGLNDFVRKQPWAESNAVVWVGSSLGAQRMLSFLLNHPGVQPQLLVRLSGGWVPELDSGFSASSSSMGLIRCPVLLVHADKDEVFPVSDAKRLAETLRTNGTLVDLRIIPDHGHSFDLDRAVVIRGVAEYCRAHLPLTDYTAELSGCSLDAAERQRFNLALQRAGLRRRELWQAVVAAKEPERRTLMIVIGGLEDYDLAHMSAGQLRDVVGNAWEARRRYPWCRQTPLDIFESVTANPRVWEEPLENYRPYFSRRLRRDIKYCQTTQEASDVIWNWMQRRMIWRPEAESSGKTPREIFDDGRSECHGLAVLYTALSRSVGLAERPTAIIWQSPNIARHYCTEVWSVEEKRWRELDSTADNRTYTSDWILRVPKALILAPTGERGGWGALAENRWQDCSNTIGLVYPSGTLAISVVDHGNPATNFPIVGIQIASSNNFSVIAEAQMNRQGEANLVLGKSADYPYRVFLKGPEDADWRWVAVESNRVNMVTLDAAHHRAFDFTAPPPLIPTKHSP